MDRSAVSYALSWGLLDFVMGCSYAYVIGYFPNKDFRGLNLFMHRLMVVVSVLGVSCFYFSLLILAFTTMDILSTALHFRVFIMVLIACAALLWGGITVRVIMRKATSRKAKADKDKAQLSGVENS